jgi:hypothetical protein
MKGKIFLLPVMVLATMQLAGCQRKSFDPALAGAFFPLRPGLSWTYRIIDESRSTTQTFTDRVIGPRRVGSANAEQVESEYYGPTGALNSSIIYFPQDGYLTRQSSFDKAAQVTLAERAFLPQLLKPDLTWSNSLTLFEQEPTMFHVVQTHRSYFDSGTVVVPAGSFSGCIRVKTEALYQTTSSPSEFPLRLTYLDWYAPRIGLVKTLVEQSGFFGAEVARVELLNFGYSQPKSATPLAMPGQTISLHGSSVSGVMR